MLSRQTLDRCLSQSSPTLRSVDSSLQYTILHGTWDLSLVCSTPFRNYIHGWILMCFLSAAWATYAAFMQRDGSNWSWRIPSLVQAVGSVMQVCLIWFIPESPRWLVSRGRVSDLVPFTLSFLNESIVTGKPGGAHPREISC